MKKSRILNIVLTAIMLLSTILTPQMAYSVSAELNGEDSEDASQVEPEETPDVDTEEDVDEDDDTDGDNGAEVKDADGENEEADADDEAAPSEDDEVADEKPKDIHNTDPPTSEEESGDEESVNENNEAVDSVGELIETFSAETRQAKDLGNIFTFESFTLNDQEIEDGSVINIDDGTRVVLSYAWNTKDMDAKAEDTASLQLPDIFKQANITNQPITTGDMTVGTYSIVDGLLQFEFNEQIENGDVQNGVAGLSLEFDLEKFQENIEQEIHFNDEQDTTLTVIARPTGDISGITKEGHPDRDQNAREITWSIDVMNNNDTLISNAILTDALPEGLGSPRDFEVYELSVGLNGEKIQGDIVDAAPGIDGNEFELNFNSMAQFSGYRVEYTTTIENYSIESFTNEALFSYGDVELPADVTVDGLTRSNPIEKSGVYNWNTHEIDWTITVNESGGEIDDALVYDSLPEEQSLVEDSIHVHRYDSNWNWLEEDLGQTDFPINLGQVEADEIYQIQFSSAIDWSQINNGNYQKHNIFTNETELRDGEISIGQDDDEVEHYRIDILEKDGVSNVDYNEKTLTWTVDVNRVNHLLGDVVVTDQLPEGLSLEEDDIQIINSEGEDYSHNGVLIAGAVEDGQTVTINFNDLGTEHITIKYKTAIEDFTIDQFNNTVSLNGEGVGEEIPSIDIPIDPPANSFGKSFEGIDYNAKTMDWKLTVNPIREDITELEIVDTFPNDGLFLLEESMNITLGGETFDDYTLTPIDDSYHNGFTIGTNTNLGGGELVVEYTTSYDPDVVENPHSSYEEGSESESRVYINRAQFTGKTENGHDFDTPRQDDTTVREEAWNSGYKEGQLVHENANGNLVEGWESGSERKVAWQLYTNYQEQNLGTGVVIEDTLDYEGTIDEDSITVLVYDVNATGDATITKTEIDDYMVDVNGKEFTLTFNEDFVVDERYVVTFTTTVPNISQPEYTNNATVKVGENAYDYTGTEYYDKHDNFLEKGAVGLDGNQVFTGEEINWEVKVNESLSSLVKNVEIKDTISPGLVYVEDSLKIATLSGAELIEGRDYTFENDVNDEGETVLEIYLTDDLEEMLVLNYTTVVTETDGQVNNQVTLNGTGINEKSVESNRLNATEFSWVGGDFSPNQGAIRVTKTDSEEEITIENNEATFVLEFELNGERVQFGDEFTTQSGILEIGNLPLRTYYLSEVDAPTGYVLSEKEIEIDVDEAFGNSETVFEAEFENTKEKIDITGTKVWEGGESVQPESIQLQLFRNNEAYGDPVTLLH